MKATEEVIEFLKRSVIECEPNKGCGRCDEARRHVVRLENEVLRAKPLKMAPKFIAERLDLEKRETRVNIMSNAQIHTMADTLTKCLKSLNQLTG